MGRPSFHSFIWSVDLSLLSAIMSSTWKNHHETGRRGEKCIVVYLSRAEKAFLHFARLGPAPFWAPLESDWLREGNWPIFSAERFLKLPFLIMLHKKFLISHYVSDTVDSVQECRQCGCIGLHRKRLRLNKVFEAVEAYHKCLLK